MARKSFAELRAEIAALILDNTTNLVEPADVRGVFLDILDAIQPAYGTLRRTVPSANIVANITPAVKVTWEAAADTDPTQTTSNFSAGTIARSERGTSVINFTADMETSANRFITFTLFKNGVATTWRITGNGGGAGNPVAVSLTAIDYADPAATYDIRMTAEIAGTTVTLSNMALIVQLLPVNTY